jgi:hypothetical protein
MYGQRSGRVWYYVVGFGVAWLGKLRSEVWLCAVGYGVERLGVVRSGSVGSEV